MWLSKFLIAVMHLFLLYEKQKSLVFTVLIIYKVNLNFHFVNRCFDI